MIVMSMSSHLLVNLNNFIAFTYKSEVVSIGFLSKTFFSSAIGFSIGFSILVISHTKPGNKMSRIVRKPNFCLCENKGADQLRGNREADQRLCFRYSDSTIPLLLKSKISRF